MIIQEICVGIVMVLVCTLITFLVGQFIVFTTDEDEDDEIEISWIFSCIALGICLTIALYSNGVLL